MNEKIELPTEEEVREVCKEVLKIIEKEYNISEILVHHLYDLVYKRYRK